MFIYFVYMRLGWRGVDVENAIVEFVWQAKLSTKFLCMKYKGALSTPRHCSGINNSVSLCLWTASIRIKIKFWVSNRGIFPKNAWQITDKKKYLFGAMVAYALKGHGAHIYNKNVLPQNWKMALKIMERIFF